MKPYVVIHRAEGGEVYEYFTDPALVNQRLNELWGPWSNSGPRSHPEARASLSERVLPGTQK